MTQIRTDLRKLVTDLQQRHPVILRAYVYRNLLTVGRIEVNKFDRDKGIGSEVMTSLFDFADQHQLTVTLSPSTDFGGTLKRLNSFYLNLGFTKNAGKDKDFEIMEVYYRSPKPPAVQNVEQQSHHDDLDNMSLKSPICKM